MYELQIKFGSPLNYATKWNPFVMIAITMISSKFCLLSPPSKIVHKSVCIVFFSDYMMSDMMSDSEIFGFSPQPFQMGQNLETLKK